jgi:sensor histidine kinase YesM
MTSIKIVMNKKELLYRWIGILTMGIVFPFMFENHALQVNPLLTILYATLQAALYWNGTIYVVLLTIRLFPPDKKMNIAIAAQFFFVGAYVLLLTTVLSIFHSKFLDRTFTAEEFGFSFLFSLLITYFISTFYAAAFFFNQWKINMIKAERLEKSQLEAQYETLKNQVNPHFLFNSLNTLLSMVECNPDAVKYVENLSEFMRYVLQTREKEVVLLRDELAMAKQYVFIQKSRFGDKLIVNIDVSEAYYHYAIPPLALQMLLENAIKHNVISRDYHLMISVYVDSQKYLVIENRINRKEDFAPSTGIGLNNIKNRYMFLSGKEVIISEENDIFKVALPLIEFKL